LLVVTTASGPGVMFEEVLMFTLSCIVQVHADTVRADTVTCFHICTPAQRAGSAFLQLVGEWLQAKHLLAVRSQPVIVHKQKKSSTGIVSAA
jgi:hypothetical protein